MKKHALILVAGISLLCGSCFYNESDVYVAEPEPGDPPVFSVFVNLDTITVPEVTDSLEVNYSAEIENGEFYLMQAYLLTDIIFESDSLENSFRLYAGDVPIPGTDTLYLIYYYSTNTNSLADIVKVEANIVRKKYGIIFR
jgi:hypothetical protein